MPKRFVDATRGRAFVLGCALVAALAWLADSPTAAVTDSAVAGRLALGSSHTCAIRSDDALVCWGSGANGQLPLPAFDIYGYTTTPVVVGPLPDALVPVEIVAGADHTCVRATDGSVWCWGSSGNGQIGHTYLNSTSPVRVTLAAAATRVAAGGNTSCALLVDGDTWCWGANGSGQLGAGIADAQSAEPVRVLMSDAVEVVALDLGAAHACAVAAAGTVWCWGNYGFGRLGSSVGSNANTPVATASLGGSAVAVSAGREHTCVLLSDAGLVCFGRNNRTQFGAALAGGALQTSAPVRVLEGVADVSAGDEHGCFLAVDAAHSCRGRYYSGMATPAGVTGTVADVESGGYHGCASTTTGDVWCWGSNATGQVGREGDDDFTAATPVADLSIATTTTTTTTTTTEAPSTTEAPATTEAPPTTPAPSTTESPETTPAPPTVPPPTVPPATTAPPVTTSPRPATTVPRTTTTARALPVIRSLSLRRGRVLTAAQVASAVSLSVPRRSRGVMRISIVSGTASCRFSGTSIVGRRAGTCRVRVVYDPVVGRTITRYTTVSVR